MNYTLRLSRSRLLRPGTGRGPALSYKPSGKMYLPPRALCRRTEANVNKKETL